MSVGRPFGRQREVYVCCYGVHLDEPLAVMARCGRRLWVESLFRLAGFGRSEKSRDERLRGRVAEKKLANGLIWGAAYGIIFVF